MATIKINGHVVPPESQVEGGAHYSADASESNYILIHCADHLKNEHYDDFRQLQVRVADYIARNTYLCHYRLSDLERLRRLPYVLYANVYHQELVVEAGLKSRTVYPLVTQGPGHRSPPQTEDQAPRVPGVVPRQTDGVARSTSTVPADQAQQSREHDVAIELHHGVSHADVQRKIAESLGMGPDGIYEDGNWLRMQLRAEDFNVVATIDDVRSIHEFPEQVYFTNVARRDIGVGDPKSAKAMGVPLGAYLGRGEVIVVTDSGFDRGVKNGPWLQPAFTDTILELVAINRQPQFEGDVSQFNDPRGHGTHVCGSIVGHGISKKWGPIMGTAPGAQLVVQSCTTKFGGTDYPKASDETESGRINIGRFTRLFEKPYTDNGARIASNSWGVPWSAQLPYNPMGAMADGIVKSNPDYLILFAAGNAGMTDSVAQIGAQAAAKNILTVGSCESSHPLRIKYELMGRNPTQTIYDYQDKAPLGKPRNIAASSNRGPTVEGRSKPDVVAPGEVIYSTLSQVWRFAPFEPLIQFRRKEFYKDAAGVDKERFVNFFDGKGVVPAADEGWFTFLNGTSQATPLVAGCAAVLRSVFRDKFGAAPSAAMLKALFVSGATDLSEGGREHDRGPPIIGPAPDPAQGFGRVNMADSLKHLDDDVNGACIDFPLPLTQGTAFDWPVDLGSRPGLAVDPNTPNPALQIILTATMAYTDVAGPELVNELNLVVTASNADYRYGNTGTRVKDGKNNVQKLVWVDIPPGPTIIRVECERITQLEDADGNLTNVAQDYALVWYADYYFRPPPGPG